MGSTLTPSRTAWLKMSRCNVVSTITRARFSRMRALEQIGDARLGMIEEINKKSVRFNGLHGDHAKHICELKATDLKICESLADQHKAQQWCELQEVRTLATENMSSVAGNRKENRCQKFSENNIASFTCPLVWNTRSANAEETQHEDFLVLVSCFCRALSPDVCNMLGS